MGFALRVRPHDRETIVGVSGEIDLLTAGQLRHILERTIRSHCPRLVLDMSGVRFMDCAGVRSLVAVQQQAERLGGTLRLAAVSAPVARIIQLSGLQGRFGGPAAPAAAVSRTPA
ncbi:MAG TPA: STAS domain-containing protein [Streptosporangiaceae bacterium]|jgi:anti-anti-sigma factor|nr:STAS domain-containing protein [Streptosporangiaceae bacterium]